MVSISNNFRLDSDPEQEDCAEWISCTWLHASTNFTGRSRVLSTI